MALRILQRHGRKTRSRAGFFVPVVQTTLKRAATTPAGPGCPSRDVLIVMPLRRSHLCAALAERKDCFRFGTFSALPLHQVRRNDGLRQPTVENRGSCANRGVISGRNRRESRSAIRKGLWLGRASITLDEWLKCFLNERFKVMHNSKLRRLFRGVFFYILEQPTPRQNTG